MSKQKYPIIIDAKWDGNIFVVTVSMKFDDQVGVSPAPYSLTQVLLDNAAQRMLTMSPDVKVTIHRTEEQVSE